MPHIQQSAGRDGSGQTVSLHDKIRDCYQRAAGCRERALRTNDPTIRASLFAAEEGWIRLAQSYELTEVVSDLDPEVRRHLRR
jgi:hypothetical protein